MSDRLQEIRARLDAANQSANHLWEQWPTYDDLAMREPFPTDEQAALAAHAPADIAWLLDEVERLQDIQERNMPWWRRDADGSLWAAPPTVDGAPEPDSDKWVRVQ